LFFYHEVPDQNAVQPVSAGFVILARSVYRRANPPMAMHGSNSFLYGTLSAASREAGGIAVSMTFGRE
jgi:hypothetical protein